MSKTSKTADKRGRADLELFLLALLSRGIATPYDLQASAGLSPGASIPALGRLEAAGYVVKGEQEARRRLEYNVSARGKKHLESSWKALLESPAKGDMDVVLRTACVALLMGEKKRVVAEYLAEGSKMRKLESGRFSLSNAPGLRHPGLYAWMRQVGEPTRTASEAAILKKIASVLKKART